MASTIGDTLNSLSIPSQNPSVHAGNQTVLDTHADVESAGDPTGLGFTTHGLTNFGETLGLGKVGGKNLLTDTVQAPGDVANGTTPTGEASALLADSSRAVKAGGDAVGAIGQDLSNPNNIANFGALGSDGLLNLGSNDSSGHLISGDVGAAGGDPVARAGALTMSDSHSPIGIDIGNGQNIANADLLPNNNVLSGSNGNGVNLGDLGNPLNLGGNDSSGHLISGDVGAAGGDPVARAGVLTTSDSQSPIGIDIGNGQNIANADLLPNSDVLSGSNGNGVNLGDLGNPLNLGGNDSSGHLISGDVGAAGGDPVARAGVLTMSDSHSPIGIDIGNGQNIANADLLPNNNVLSGSNGNGVNLGDLGNPLNLGGNDSSGHLISGDVGAAGGDTIAKAGVLTISDSQSPVGIDIGNGQNIASADLLPNNNVLSGSNPILGQDLGNGVNLGDLGSGSGEPIVSAGAGAPGSSPLLNGGILASPDGQQPISVVAGDGQNIADVNALSSTHPLDLGANGGLGNIGGLDDSLSGDMAGLNGNAFGQGGVTIGTGSQGPLGDIGNGLNVGSGDVNLTGDALRFPDLGGVGSDILAGLNPSPTGLGDAGSGFGDDGSGNVAGGNGGSGDSMLSSGDDGGGNSFGPTPYEPASHTVIDSSQPEGRHDSTAAMV